MNANYSVNGDYYFLNQDEDTKKEVYRKTGELMKDFVTDYTTNYMSGQEENVRRTRIATLADSTEDLLEFISVMDFAEKIYGYKIREIGKEQALAYYKFTGLKDNNYVTDFTEAYTAWVNAVIDDPTRASDAYREVSPYYEMSDDFVASLFGINTLLKNETAMGVLSE